VAFVPHFLPFTITFPASIAAWQKVRVDVEKCSAKKRSSRISSDFVKVTVV
jgi:hypothetical protein